MQIAQISLAKQNYFIKPPKVKSGYTNAPKNNINFTSDTIKIFKRKTDKLQEGQILDLEKNQPFNRHTTIFFRSDLDWQDFGNYLKEKFSNESKVNTYVWGCSYGEEPYSLVMLLKQIFKDCEKFFPIQAIDIDSKIIDMAKRKKEEGVEVPDWMIKQIFSQLKTNKNKFIYKYDADNKTGYLDSGITKPVEFSVGNIVTDIGLMDSKHPSIVFCRNMWPYINHKKYLECAKKMYDTLSKGSIIVIGSYDYRGDDRYYKSDTFPSALEYAGFKGIKRTVSNNDYYMNDFLIFEKE